MNSQAKNILKNVKVDLEIEQEYGYDQDQEQIILDNINLARKHTNNDILDTIEDKYVNNKCSLKEIIKNIESVLN